MNLTPIRGLHHEIDRAAPACSLDRLVDTLLAWLAQDRELEPEINRFHVRVWQDGNPNPTGAAAGDRSTRPAPPRSSAPRPTARRLAEASTATRCSSGCLREGAKSYV